MKPEELIAKKFGPVVEHAGSGIRMPEATARIIEAAAKGLPADFTFRRFAKTASDISCDNGSRTDVSTITTDDVDRDGEIVLPSGGDWGDYNKVVTFAHRYDQLPAGSNQWMKGTASGRGIMAKTHYPLKPDDWGDSQWLPSAVLHMMQQPVPTCTGKSIGFLPQNIRQATPDEIKARPEMQGKPIIDKWKGIEYAVAPVPANARAEMQAVAKGVSDGIFDAKTAAVMELAMRSFLPSLKAAHDYSSTHVYLPPAAAEKCKAMANRIPDEHLAEDGREDKPHATILYGLHTNDAEKVRKALADEPPIMMRMGKTGVFMGKDADVVHCAVHSPDLHRIRQKLAAALPHVQTHPDYSPHVTLAYVHPGMGEKYKDMSDMDGMTMSMGQLSFADKDGKETHFPLSGGTVYQGPPLTNDPDNPAIPGNVSPLDGHKPIADSAKPAATKTGAEGNNSSGGSVVMPDCPKCGTNDAVSAKDDYSGDMDTDEMTQSHICDMCGTKFTPGTAKAHSGEMMVNDPGVAHAHSLVSSGKVNDGPWSFVGADREKAEPDQYLAYRDDGNPQNSGHWALPVIKGGEVYRRAVAAAEGRAAANGYAKCAAKAKEIMEAIQARDDKGKTAKAIADALAVPHIKAEDAIRRVADEARAFEARIPGLITTTIAEVIDAARGRV